MGGNRRVLPSPIGEQGSMLLISHLLHSNYIQNRSDIQFQFNKGCC